MNDRRVLVAYSLRHTTPPRDTAQMAEWMARAGTGPAAEQVEAKAKSHSEGSKDSRQHA
jgi:hypothetical protein